MCHESLKANFGQGDFHDQKAETTPPRADRQGSSRWEAMLATGKSSAEVYQALAISEATWMRWKKQFGGMKSDEAKRLRELQVENQRLKELLTEAKLAKQILTEAAVESL